MDYTAGYDSPLGHITMASDGTALTGLWFDDQRFFAATLDDACEDGLSDGAAAIFTRTAEWLDDYFAGKDPGTPPPLAPKGSAFRQQVWGILLSIPYGATMSYGGIAARIAASRGVQRMSAQAVGGAVGHNPISIIIPCHRVLGSDGSLTGYAGGMDRKRVLLELEGWDGSAPR